MTEKTKTILIVCATHEQAKEKFKQAIKEFNAELTAHRISYTDLQIDFHLATYKFVPTSPDLEVRLCGLSCDSIIVEEFAKLSPEQETFLRTIERPLK